MLTNLKRTLSKTKKYKLWQEAYVYNVCSQAIQIYVREQTGLGDSLDLFLKLQSTRLQLTLTSKNPTILAWLKTHQEELREQVRKKLEEQDFSGEREIVLKFKGG